MAQPETDISFRYYYYRDASRNPLITLCRVEVWGCIAYAWAICSPTDRPHKDDLYWQDAWVGTERRAPGGKTIAKGRAMRALRTGTPVNDTVRVYARPIVREEALHVIADCEAYALLSLSGSGRFDNLPKSMQPPMEGEAHA